MSENQTYATVGGVSGAFPGSPYAHAHSGHTEDTPHTPLIAGHSDFGAKGEGLSDHRIAGQPDPFGSVPVLSPRRVTTHRARTRARAADSTTTRAHQALTTRDGG